jgi:predicted phage tail protein
MINLYGGLARKFKKVFGENPRNIPIIVNSPQEAVRAMDANFPGFKNLIRKKGYYKIVRGQDVMDDSKSLGDKELTMKFADDSWHFMPIASGAGGNGILQMVLGAVIFAIGTVMYYTPLAWAAPYVQMAGIGLMIGGLATMLSPMPQMPKDSGQEDTPSYLFNGAINVAAPGLTVPVAYGETWIGDIPISFGVLVDDLGSNPTPPPPAPPAPPPTYTPPTEPTEPDDDGGGNGSGMGGGSDGGDSGGDSGGAGSAGDGCGPGDGCTA